MQNTRLSISTTLSLLLHLFVFFSVNIYLQFDPINPKEKKVEQLEVRFTQAVAPKPQPKPEKKILASTAPAPFQVTQVPVEKPPVIAPTPPAPVIEPAPPATEQVTGIALPGSIPTPFPVQGRSNNSPFQARSAQQDAARTYYQQVQAAQERQRTEFQAQLMTQHLQQMLAQILDVQPLVSGKCELVQPDNAQRYRLKCDSSALYETISKDEKNVVDVFIALRGMGRNFNGFSAGEEAGKPRTSLIYMK